MNTKVDAIIAFFGRIYYSREKHRMRGYNPRYQIKINNSFEIIFIISNTKKKNNKHTIYPREKKGKITSV